MKFIVRRVTHSGIVIRGVRYWHPALLPHSGTCVLVPRRKRGEDSLKVYDSHGTMICVAKRYSFAEEATYIGGDSPITPEEALSRFSAASIPKGKGVTYI